MIGLLLRVTRQLINVSLCVMMFTHCKYIRIRVAQHWTIERPESAPAAVATDKNRPSADGRWRTAFKSRRVFMINQILVTCPTFPLRYRYSEHVRHTCTAHIYAVHSGAPEPRGQRGPAALVVRGRTGAEKCHFLQDNS